MASESLERSASTAARAFVRRSSGLVRSFSVVDVTIINIACVCVGANIVLGPFFAAYLWPDAHAPVSLTFGAILMLFVALEFGLLSAAMPRSGGDYVFNSRIIHPAFGFMVSWGMTWSLFLAVGLYSTWLLSFYSAPALAIFGLVTNNPGLVQLSSELNTPIWTFVGGVAGIALVSAVMLVGTQFVRDVFRVLMALGMLGVLITIGFLLFTPNDTFIASLNSVMASTTGNPDTYGLILQQASDAGWTSSNATLGGALMALPFGFWMFLGFTYSAYISGEVKEPQKSQPMGMVLALGIALVLMVAGMTLTYTTLGWDFVHAVGFLENSGEGTPFPAQALLTLFMGMINTNPLFNAVLEVLFFIWNFMLVMVVALCPIRNIFAWAFDRLLPEGVTATTSKGVPWAATLVVAAVAVGVLFLYAFTGVLTYLVNYITLLAIVFFLTSISAIVLPYAKKEIYETAPRVVRTKIAGIPLITISGVISLLAFGFIIYSSLALPAFSGPTGWQSYLFLAALFGSGLVYYYVVRAIRRAQGIDIDLNWQEIPPE